MGAQHLDTECGKVVGEHVGPQVLAAHDERPFGPNGQLCLGVGTQRFIKRENAVRRRSQDGAVRGPRDRLGRGALQVRPHVLIAEAHLTSHPVRRQIALARHLVDGVAAQVQDAHHVLDPQGLPFGKREVTGRDVLGRGRARGLGGTPMRGRPVQGAGPGAIVHGKLPPKESDRAWPHGIDLDGPQNSMASMAYGIPIGIKWY